MGWIYLNPNEQPYADTDQYTDEHAYKDSQAHTDRADRYAHGDIATADGDLHSDPGVSACPRLNPRSLAWKRSLC